MNDFNIEGISNYTKDNATKICIGTFDGYHKGHQELTKDSDYLVTFYPHPKSVILGKEKVEILTFPDELNYFYKKRITIPFNKEIQSMTAIDFLDKIIGKLLHPSQITIGYDFKFGVNQSGSGELLRTWGIKNNCKIIEVPKQIHHDGTTYKSSVIREKLKTNVNLALELLGHPYPISGTVIKGKNRGKKIGFPTANIVPIKGKCLPKNGVYRSSVIIDSTSYNSITNIGLNPTYENQKISIETHILNNFNQDLYGKKIIVLIHHFIREEKKFDSEEALVKQIKQDINHSSVTI